MVKDINIEDFDYPLPDSKIALHPLPVRDACRLLAVSENGRISHETFSRIPSLLPDNTLLICNDTRVINARMEFRKPSGARIEVFLLEPADPSDYVLNFQSESSCVWNCLVGNSKRWKDETLEKSLNLQGVAAPVTLRVEKVGDSEGASRHIRFSWQPSGVSFASIVEAAGNIPIPPYLNRSSEESDDEDYQTVYADASGSVAAPTAGLHFTPGVFNALGRRGIEVEKLTLHVGAGTFQPVKSETIGGHPMHTETFTVSRRLVENIIEAKQSGLRIAAVGTTSVRTLESLPFLGRHIAEGRNDMHVTQWEAYDMPMSDGETVDCLNALLEYMESLASPRLTASTAIMIAPGFRWSVADILITNFHQPKSTLLLLVSSFLEQNPLSWRDIYAEALENDYRFLSYGDACLFFRKK